MDYMFINKPEFAEPIRVLFLCGAKFDNSISDKRIVLKKYLEQDPKNRVILLEKYFDFALKKGKRNNFLSYYSVELFNLYNIESFAALVATNIILLHETLSTAGELGVFGSNYELRDRIITLVPEHFSVEEEKLSNFLRLAFWNTRDRLIQNKVIRYYPAVKKTMISENHFFYKTYFVGNEFPQMLGRKLNSQLNQSPISAVSILPRNKFWFNRETLTVRLSYTSIKNYLLSILSVSENRKAIRNCTKLYEIRNILYAKFNDAVKNSYRKIYNVTPKNVIVEIDCQPNYNFQNVLSFMIYFWHACKIMTITCNEQDTITVSFPKGTSSLWAQYSQLIKPVTFCEWGE